MSEPDNTEENKIEEEEEVKEQKQVVPQLNLMGGEAPNMVIDDSIMITERTMVKGRQEEPEQVNEILREEILKINQSLAKISQCLNVRALFVIVQAFKVEDSQTSQITVNVQEDVCTSLS